LDVQALVTPTATILVPKMNTLFHNLFYLFVIQLVCPVNYFLTAFLVKVAKPRHRLVVRILKLAYPLVENVFTKHITKQIQ
jgi:hypothetical protein